ncbi:hypothetical protein M378DRAFT_801768 [Amanita muscaria Koide BX008]|uniref:Uncharacterized protein n=1 Tax=Amanita muscaria (strain Koide BX008) TaxID=946122 RepID=A0A0C2X0H0_AMAMK|nr:hypothetical protein M378DRAFT_801768 [Amanita muscaria Koide BX008]
MISNQLKLDGGIRGDSNFQVVARTNFLEGQYGLAAHCFPNDQDLTWYLQWEGTIKTKGASHRRTIKSHQFISHLRQVPFPEPRSPFVRHLPITPKGNKTAQLNGFSDRDSRHRNDRTGCHSMIDMSTSIRP